MHALGVVTPYVSRHQRFAALCILATLVLGSSLKTLLELSLRDERYTYILALPVISLTFLYLERDRIFNGSRYCPAAGIPVILLGLAMFLVGGMRPSLSHDATFAGGMLVILWTGAFVLCYGIKSLQSAAFPFLLLLFVVPIPSVVLDKVVTALQKGSAAVAYFIFRVTGVPSLRHGMVISLPGVDIEVAPQCSGIRSTTGLFIAGAMVSRLLLRTGRARMVAMLCVGPIAVFRNAVRIVCISLLGIYVDRGFLSGSLHHKGGLLFSLVGFAILIPLIWFLRSWERPRRERRPDSSRSGDPWEYPRVLPIK